MKNKNFKVGQRVVCTLGLNAGKIFIIKIILNNGYSCVLEGEENKKYYQYNDDTLELATE